MSTKTPRQQQAADQRDHLVDTALTLFAQQGYDATSIKQIATSAGVSMGLLYHYFASKREVLQAIWERHSFLPELRSLLEIEQEETAADVLKHIADSFSALLIRKESLFRLMVRESQSNPEVAACMQSVMGEGMRLLTAYLDTRIQMGELRTHNPALTGRMLFGTVLTTHMARLPPPDWQSLVDQLLAGINNPSRSR